MSTGGNTISSAGTLLTYRADVSSPPLSPLALVPKLSVKQVEPWPGISKRTYRDQKTACLPHQNRVSKAPEHETVGDACSQSVPAGRDYCPLYCMHLAGSDRPVLASESASLRRATDPEAGRRCEPGAGETVSDACLKSGGTRQHGKLVPLYTVQGEQHKERELLLKRQASRPGQRPNPQSGPVSYSSELLIASPDQTSLHPEMSAAINAETQVSRCPCWMSLSAWAQRTPQSSSGERGGACLDAALHGWNARSLARNVTSADTAGAPHF